jgi:flagellar motor component MotA
MNERGNNWLLLGAVLGVLFTLLNLANLVFLARDVARNLIAVAIGIVWTMVAYARYLGWKGLLR